VVIVCCALENSHAHGIAAKRAGLRLLHTGGLPPLPKNPGVCCCESRSASASVFALSPRLGGGDAALWVKNGAVNSSS
jgi:hypothetical protein